MTASVFLQVIVPLNGARQSAENSDAAPSFAWNPLRAPAADTISSLNSGKARSLRQSRTIPAGYSAPKWGIICFSISKRKEKVKAWQAHTVSHLANSFMGFLFKRG